MLHERTRRLAEQHLTAVGRGADPGASMHVEADVPFDAPPAFAGVQPHPDPHRDPVRPLGTGESPLSRRRRAGGARRAREDHEQCVAGGVHLDAPLIDSAAARIRLRCR